MLFNAYKLPSRKAYTTIITVCKIVPLPSRHNSFIHAFIHSLTPSFIDSSDTFGESVHAKHCTRCPQRTLRSRELKEGAQSRTADKR